MDDLEQPRSPSFPNIYNKYQDHPLIISGWKDVEALYDLPANVVVQVGYYGNVNFGITKFKCLFDLDGLPRFHSRFFGSKGIIVSDLGLTVETRKNFAFTSQRSLRFPLPSKGLM
ncbi:unnamed protein product [Vicia faba]|uniref:Uncharacterized protein n=1 Tax=Vicia faba TaxID=3906 RepID=A0AAV0ZVF4_VICFA|nr:unnamed protein product [Vicia faba]